MKITIIGESNIDIAVVPHSNANSKGCTPGNIAFHYGGVARNIAHNLCLLGHEVQLVSVFGNDRFATQLINDCQRLGIDLSFSSQFKETKSPIFLSFNDNTGNMISAVSDVDINERMDLNWLLGKMDVINKADIVVADTLLSAEALAYLIDQCKAPLFIDTVSPGKAMRFANAIKQSKKNNVFALKCNRAEATQITGENDAVLAAKKPYDSGINNVYLTIGSSGVIFCSEGLVSTYPVIPSQVVNVTGSGDAFFAGVIHAFTIGAESAESIQYGLKMAKANCEVDDTVCPVLPADFCI